MSNWMERTMIVLKDQKHKEIQNIKAQNKF